MPRRKVSMGLIPNGRVRATTFGKRKEGLKKKARELATLCGVRVAVVTADGAGAGGGASSADVWESVEGVLDAYREQVAPEERAKHTHAAYAELELRKAEAKLVKVRQEGPAALAQWDAAVYALTLDEARRMLAAVDGAVRAVSERRAALGLPVDDDGGGFDGGGGWIRGFVAPPGASDAVVPFGLAAHHPFVGSNLVSFDGGYLQLRAQGGGNANNEHVMWDNNNGFDPRGAGMVQQPGYAFQQCAADMDGYKLQMAAEMYGGNSSSSTGGRLAWDAFQPPTNELAAMQPHGYSFQCTGTGNTYVGMSGYSLSQQMPGNNNSIVYPSLETGYNFIDTPAAHAAAAQGIGGRSLAGSNFNATAPALSLTMGTGGNYVNVPQAPQPLAMSFHVDLINASDYASQWSAGQLESDGSSQQSSNKQLWEALQ